MPYIIAAIIAPIITALVAAVGVWWKDRHDRHDVDQKCQRALSQVREEIRLIQDWVKAYSLIVSHEIKLQAWYRVENDLEDAYARFSEALEKSREMQSRSTLSRHFGVLLLAYPVQGWLAKFMRTFYHVSLVVMAIWISLIVGFDVSRPKGWTGVMIGLILYLLVNFIISSGSYALARHLDRRASAPAAGPIA